MKLRTVATAPTFAPETLAQVQREGNYVLLWKHRHEETYSIGSADQSLDNIRGRQRSMQALNAYARCDFAIARPIRPVEL